MKHPLKFLLFVLIPVLVFTLAAYACKNSNKKQPETEMETDAKMVRIQNPLILPLKVKLALRDSIVQFGMGLLGTRYVEGACSEDGFDCSGFVYYVFSHFKIQIPRSSSEFKDFGIEVSIDSVKKGDILVFLSPSKNAIGHVGIVTLANGMKSDFIHATSGTEMKVIISSLKQEGYTRRFVKSVNVL